VAGIEDQRTKQRAAFLREVAKLMENLKAQFKQENEKLATSFTERIEAAHKKLREKFNNKLQEEIQGIPDRLDILKKYNEDDTDKLTKSVNFK
jgi:selenocysteine lyase/cysteine desulfurase